MRLRVFAAIMIVTVMLSQPSHATPPEWLTNIGKAQAQAKREHKPLLIDFRAEWCGPCHMMEREVFQNQAIGRILRSYVCVRIDIDKDKRTAKQYDVHSIPRLVVVAPNGQTVYDQEGYARGADYVNTLGQWINPGRAKPAKGDVISGLILQLASFNENERRQASADLLSRSYTAVPVLVGALNNPQLSIRCGAYDVLQRIIASHPMAIAPPAYDPWSSLANRKHSAAEWERWWRSSKR